MARPANWKSAAEILAGAHPLPAADFCGTCDYPLITAPNGTPCLRCYEKRLEQRVKRSEYVQMIGGEKAWKEYRPSSFIRTPINGAALDAADGWDGRTNLLFEGPAGTGKSALAGIAKRRLILAGKIVTTISMPKVVDELVANIKSQRYGNEWVQRLISAPILSIEDVGAGERLTEFVCKLYFRVIDGRYGDDRPGMIVTSNHSLPVLKGLMSRFDQPGRVVSRLKEMCRIFSLNGERDWRQVDSTERARLLALQQQGVADPQPDDERAS